MTPAPGPLRAVRRALGSALPSLGSVRTGAGCAALTFDDGPDPEVTPRALDALGSAGALATFFMLASRAEAAPGLVARVLAEGHEIGLHGGDHVALPEASMADVVGCIRGGRRRLEAVTGTRVRLFRPPYGRQDLRSYLTARASGLTVVAWSAQVDDWLDDQPEVVVDRLRDRLVPGAVVLLHDGLLLGPGVSAGPSFDRAALVARLVGVLAERGLQGVTVTGLLASGPAVRFPWFA